MDEWIVSDYLFHFMKLLFFYLGSWREVGQHTYCSGICARAEGKWSIQCQNWTCAPAVLQGSPCSGHLLGLGMLLLSEEAFMLYEPFFINFSHVIWKSKQRRLCYNDYWTVEYCLSWNRSNYPTCFSFCPTLRVNCCQFEHCDNCDCCIHHLYCKVNCY